MISKDQLAASMIRECDIAVHLFGKLQDGALEYRPTEGQRTTLELLRCLSVCGIAGIHAMEADDLKLVTQRVAEAGTMRAEEFPGAMERQKQQIAAWFDRMDEATLETHQARVPGWGAIPLGLAILNAPLKWLTAYRMQLFLYAKATGAAEIGTANAWAGMDWKR